MFERLAAGALRRLAGEEGSLVLALLATIVVGGLVTVVVAAVLTGQRSVLFDQEYTGALHVGEAGVEQVVYRLNNAQIADGDTGTGTLNGEPFTWEAEQDPDDEHIWHVLSTGGDDDGVRRTVKVTIADDPLFPLAAFSDLHLGLSGANNADSYNSDDPDDWCTGNGRVGSNDELEFSGQAGGQATCEYDNSSATVDGVDLFDWNGDNADPSRCDHNVNPPNNCWHDGGGSDPRFETDEDPIPFIDDVDWMDEELDDCEGSAAWTEEFRASDHDGVLEPAGSSNGHEVDFDAVMGAGPGETHVHCVGQLIFDEHTILSGASTTEPVVFLVRDGIEVKQGITVNCQHQNGDVCDESGGSFDATNVSPVAAELQIYSPSQENPNVSTGDVVGMRSQARFGGAVLAPNGPCGGVTGGGGGGGVGGAATHVFGALICSDIRNAGGWQFHYDDALQGAMRTGLYQVVSWEER